MKKCPFCKHGILEKKTVKETYTYRGYSAEIEQPGEWCDTCGEGILSGDDLRATESEIRDFQAKVDRLPVSRAFMQKAEADYSINPEQ